MGSATQITFSDLTNLDTGNWPDTIAAWDHLVDGLEVNAEYLDLDVKKPLAASWQSDAAQLAQDKVSKAKDGLQGSQQQIKQVAAELRDFYSKLSALRWGVITMISFPTATGQPQPFPPNYTPVPTNLAKAFVVSSDGTVNLAPGVVSNPSIEAARRTFQANIQWFVDEANALDKQAADELRKLMPKPVTKPSPHKKPTAKPGTMGGGPPVQVLPWPDQTGSLWGIAQKVYGNGAMWPYIYQANVGKPGIPANWDWNVIQVGWHIIVPEISVHSKVPPVPDKFQ